MALSNRCPFSATHAISSIFFARLWTTYFQDKFLGQDHSSVHRVLNRLAQTHRHFFVCPQGRRFACQKVDWGNTATDCFRPHQHLFRDHAVSRPGDCLNVFRRELIEFRFNDVKRARFAASLRCINQDDRIVIVEECKSKIETVDSEIDHIDMRRQISV